MYKAYYVGQQGRLAMYCQTHHRTCLIINIFQNYFYLIFSNMMYVLAEKKNLFCYCRYPYRLYICITKPVLPC